MAHPHITGTPCWLDMSTDLKQATAFYGAVFGWTFTDLGPEYGGFQIARCGDADIASIGPSDTPSPWNVYLSVDDIDAIASAAVDAGGQLLLPPGDVGPLGRAARVADPGGAAVGLWQAGTHPGFGAMGPHGTPVWFEVNTRDGAAVRDFFAGLFGLAHEKMEGMEYFTLHAEGRPRYGVLQMNEMWKGMDPNWMVYFCADQVDTSCEAVRAAGGVVEYPPFDTPFGRIAICRDPMGTPFTLVTPPTPGSQHE